MTDEVAGAAGAAQTDARSAAAQLNANAPAEPAAANASAQAEMAKAAPMSAQAPAAQPVTAVAQERLPAKTVIADVKPAAPVEPVAEKAPDAPPQPTVAEMEAKRNEENLTRAKEHGFREPAPPSHDERVAALVEGFEHQVKNNGPITLDMLRELKDLLGVGQ